MMDITYAKGLLFRLQFGQERMLWTYTADEIAHLCTLLPKLQDFLMNSRGHSEFFDRRLEEITIALGVRAAERAQAVDSPSQ